MYTVIVSLLLSTFHSSKTTKHRTFRLVNLCQLLKVLNSIETITISKRSNEPEYDNARTCIYTVSLSFVVFQISSNLQNLVLSIFFRKSRK